MKQRRSSAPGATMTRARAAFAALALAFGGCAAAEGLAAQEIQLPAVAPAYEASLARRVEREVHGALLASDDELRDAHIAAAEQLARHLVQSDSLSAEAHYWLSLALGVKTEFSGPFQKLTTGREVFFVTARVLELDPDHPGGHEMMGRLHAAPGAGQAPHPGGASPGGGAGPGRVGRAAGQERGGGAYAGGGTRPPLPPGRDAPVIAL